MVSSFTTVTNHGKRTDPSPSFRFHVEVDGVKVARFTECSGFEIEQDVLEVKEGGLNSFTYRLPGRIRFGNVTLKRGISEDGADLWNWVVQTIESANRGIAVVHTVTVTLHDLSGKPLRVWQFRDAFPQKWSATALSADQNSIAIETLVLAHQGLSIA